MMGTAIILTHGSLAQIDAKTAHGLIRGTERFNIIGVIDGNAAGRDAGEVLDGKPRNIPVYDTIENFMRATGVKPDYCIIGVALSGGRLNDAWQTLLMEAIQRGISVVNGMHMLLGDIPAFRAAAEKYQVEIVDIRRLTPFDQRHYWSGRIFEMTVPRLAVLGVDCAVGKRTTCRLLLEACRQSDIHAEMIYTGQTGWLQGSPYGFILDATLNDFVSGELEAAVVQCETEAAPDLILIEGQSSLQNPIGPCGSEMIKSANVKGVILQYTPFRKYFDGVEELGCRLPTVDDEIRMIEMYGSRVVAITLNGEGGTATDLATFAGELEARIGLPVVMPLEEGLDRILIAVRRFMVAHTGYPDTTILETAC
ncbi:hypothetical protein DSCO28_58990 [Desulfosarcina ovata subsp. sediminis]|uniref:EBNA-1 nuclear protein n=1 Tax=Desulfosarcina ovata subsp. sediminis TaxID=885957 RepID=A0A5K7ZYI1_9BACT|nr:DUF1611 domain-containing protein [Desulfosarcina ovata]BBO85333.1 hypothetical protein DSCO28_58990 [Desulfosarcina ovata subsp. sediminis]